MVYERKSKGVVDKAVCEELLRWLGKNQPRKPIHRRTLHFLRAFALYAEIDRPCILTYQQFRDYCKENKAASVENLSPATLQKECSRLSQLLSAACYRLGWDKRVTVTFDEIRKDDFVARLVFANMREKAKNAVEELDSCPMDDREFLEEFLGKVGGGRSKQAPRQAKTAVPEDYSSSPKNLAVPLRSDFKSTQIPPKETSHHKKAKIEHIPLQVKSQFCELTQLICSFKLPREVTDDMADHILAPYKKIYQKIVQRFRGLQHSEWDERLAACFGYPERLELHAQRATEAALIMLRLFERERHGSETRSSHPKVYITVHSCRALIEESSEEHKVPVVTSQETTHIYKQLEKLDYPHKVVVSKSTYTTIKNFFECKPVHGRTTKGPHGKTIAAYQVINKKNTRSILVPTKVIDIPLIGRDEEFKRLKLAWANANNGQPRMVWLRGMRGVGKSELINQLISSTKTEADAPCVLICKCWKCCSHTAFYPIIQMLKFRLELEKEVSAKRQEEELRWFAQQYGLEPKEVVPVLRALIGDPKDYLSSQDEQEIFKHSFQTAEAIANRDNILRILQMIILALASTEPVLLAAEDLHWADSATRELLRRLVQEIGKTSEPTRILIVASCSKNLNVHPINEPTEILLPLNRLDYESSCQLVKLIAEKTKNSISRNEITSIAKKTGGIPQLILQEAACDYSPGFWFNKIMSESEPDARYMGFAIKCSYVAQIAAVLGLTFDYKHLQAAILGTAEIQSEHEDLLRKQVGHLLETELLSRYTGTTQEMYHFTCERIHKLFYTSMSTRDREELHLKIANLLEQHFPEVGYNSPEKLARHYSCAGNRGIERAVVWWHRAAGTAMKHQAQDEIIYALKKALEFNVHLPKTRENMVTKLRLLLDTAMTYELASGPAAPKVQKAYKKAWKLAEKVSEVPLFFRAQWAYWLLKYVQGDLQTARKLVEELLQNKAYQDIPECRLETYHAMWDTFFHLGHLQNTLPYHFYGITIARNISNEQQRPGFAGHAASVCCLSRGAILAGLLGHADQAVKISQEAIKLADTLEHSNSLAQAHSCAAILHVLVRQPESTLVHAKQALACAKGQPLKPRVMLSRILCSVAQLQKQPDKNAIEQLEQTLAEWLGIGINLFQTLWLAILAQACLDIGNIRRGRKHIEAAFKVTHETHESFYRPELHRLKGELLLASSPKNRNKAKQQFIEAIEQARNLGTKLLELRALVSLNRLQQTGHKRSQERRNALNMLKQSYGQFLEGLDTPDIVEAKTLIDALS